MRLRQRHGARVTGVDASPDMIALCRERSAVSGEDDVEFVLSDVATCAPLQQPEHFDVVWSRDCGAFLPFDRKQQVWAATADCLAPGGRLLVTDYCLGPGTARAALLEQMLSWGQHMVAPDYYAEMLAAVGYTEVEVIDRTDLLLTSMHLGVARLRERQSEFTAAFGSDAYDAILARWERKIGYCDDTDLVWTVVTATRPPQ